MTTADKRVRRYLGRILDGDGDPLGKSFQVTPGVLVTAWHVFNDIGVATEDTRVQVDPLADDNPFDGAAASLDKAHNPTVLISDASLPAAIGDLTATDQMTLHWDGGDGVLLCRGSQPPCPAPHCDWPVDGARDA